MAGHIVCIIGGKGGVGKSQFAGNFAFTHAMETRGKTLLLDFDQKAAGDQNFIVGLQSKRTIKDLADFNGSMDARVIQQFIVSHPQGVSYIGMPKDITMARSINVEGLGKFLKAVNNIFPVTVIDLGSDLNELASKALEFATVIFLVTTPDILALNQSKRLYSELITMMIPKEMIQIILNQAVQGHPVTSEVVGKAMGKPVFSIVPKDETTCVAALNKKQPAALIAKGSAFAKGLADCSRKIIQKRVFQTLAALSRPKTKKIESISSADHKKTGDLWNQMKLRIHRALVEEMDMGKNNDDDPKAQIILREKTKKTIIELLGKEDTKSIIKTRDDMNQMVKEILNEALGLGPLEDLLSDKQCSEIMVVGPSKIYYEHGGKIKLSKVTFSSDRQVLNVIERIVAPIGRRIDEKTPYVDARLRDGSRVHAIIPPRQSMVVL